MRVRIRPLAWFGFLCTLRKFPIVVMAVTLSLALFGSSAVSADDSVSFTQPVNVSSDGLGSVPQIVVDSSDDIDIAYADLASTPYCSPSPHVCVWTGAALKFRRSSDGGKTFSSPVLLAPQ